MKHIKESIIGRRGGSVRIPIVFWNQYDPADMSVVLDVPVETIGKIAQNYGDGDRLLELDTRNLDNIHFLYMSGDSDCVACKDTGCKTLGELRNKFDKEYNGLRASISDIWNQPWKYEIHIGEAYIPIGSVLQPEISPHSVSNPNSGIQVIFHTQAAWDALIEFRWNMPEATSTSGSADSYGYAMLDIKHKKVIESPRGDIKVRIEDFNEFYRRINKYKP